MRRAGASPAHPPNLPGHTRYFAASRPPRCFRLTPVHCPNTDSHALSVAVPARQDRPSRHPATVLQPSPPLVCIPGDHYSRSPLSEPCSLACTIPFWPHHAPAPTDPVLGGKRPPWRNASAASPNRLRLPLASPRLCVAPACLSHPPRSQKALFSPGTPAPLQHL